VPEVLTSPTPEDAALAASAKAVLAAIDQEWQRLNASKPPRDDAPAMARRAQHRDALQKWGDGPRAFLEQARQRATPANKQESRVRVVRRE